MEPVQGAVYDVLQVDRQDILEVYDETGVTNWLAQVNAARASLPPASDRSATMTRLQEMFGSRQRLKRIARQFPRSMVEYFASFSYCNISTDKANHMLGVVTNPRFRPTDILYRTVETIENKILKACFPDGYKTKDLTRKKDSVQKVSSL